MTSINGIGNVGYRPVVAFTSTEPYKSDTQAATAMPQQKEEKKSKHTVLKVLTVAAVVAGAVLLFKNRGKVVDKIKTLIDRLKPVKPQVKPQVNPTPPAGLDEIDRSVKLKNEVKKALSQKPVITAETIDAGVAAKEAGISAKESASVFQEYGLTQYERGFADGQKVSGAAVVPENVSAPQVVKPTGRKTVRKPRGIMPVRPKPIAPQVDNKIPKIEIPDVNNNAQIKPKTKKPKSGYYEPSKNTVIRDHSNLGPSEKVQPRSKTNSRKTRHNKRQIIDQTLAQEQAEFAPSFHGTKKTKKATTQTLQQSAQPKQVINRASIQQGKTPHYVYPESVYKYETELAAKQKAADIKAAWSEYEYRNFYGE